VLQNLREFLSFIRLPRILTLKLAGCNGDDNAWYEPEDLTITVCYEYLEEVRKLAPTAGAPTGLTAEDRFFGPLIEVFLHEVGHALFDQLHIPILGREEDAADQFAAFVMVHLSSPIARDAVAGVAWMYAEEAKDAKIGQDSLANVHGLEGALTTPCAWPGAELRCSGLIERNRAAAGACGGCEGNTAGRFWDRDVDEPTPTSPPDKVLAKTGPSAPGRRRPESETA
jgi:hypothetical protein